MSPSGLFLFQAPAFPDTDQFKYDVSDGNGNTVTRLVESSVVGGLVGHTLVATNGNDVERGTAPSDSVSALDGADLLVVGLGSEDRFFGGDGNDIFSVTTALPAASGE